MKATELDLKIISAEKTIFSGKVTMVSLPGMLGSFTILPDHAPLVSALIEGTVKYETNGTENSVEIKGGFIEVNKNIVTVCIE